MGLASAANTEGLTVYAVAIAAVNMAVAVTETVLAAQDLVDAQQALVDSRAKLVATSTYAAGVYGSLADAVRVYRETCETGFKRPMRRAMCSYFVHIASTPEEENYGKEALVRYFQDALVAALNRGIHPQPLGQAGFIGGQKPATGIGEKPGVPGGKCWVDRRAGEAFNQIAR